MQNLVTKTKTPRREAILIIGRCGCVGEPAVPINMRPATDEPEGLVKSFTTCDTIRPTFGPFGFLPFAGRGIDMPQITVDGKRIECKDRQMILQACLDAEMP